MDNKPSTKKVVLFFGAFFLIGQPIIGIIYYLVLRFPRVSLIVVFSLILISFLFILFGSLCKRYSFFLLSTARMILFCICAFWAFGGFFPIVCCFSGTLFKLRFPSTKILFPLGSIKAIDVDREGNVYCAERCYNRLQVFDKNGQFLRGWFVPISNGPVDLFVDERQNINVYQWEGVYTYNPNGSLIRFRSDDGRQLSDNKHLRRQFSDNTSFIYDVHGMLGSRIIKYDQEYQELGCINTPLHLLPFRFPFPIFFFLLGSLLLFGLSHSLIPPKPAK